MEFLSTLRVGHVDDSLMEPAEKVDPLFAVGLSCVLRGDNRPVENRFTTLEIQAMATEIGCFGSSHVATS